MDSKEVGEYLKRLRLRAGYTQSYTANAVNVTDKAISRWESGIGFPEISNLMVLAKLYGVSVDDILNCNETVFTDSKNAQEEEDVRTETEITESLIAAAPPCEEITEAGRKTSSMFEAVLLFAYLVLGTSLATFAMYSGFLIIAAILIFGSIIGIVLTVVNLFGNKISVKAQSRLNISMYSVLTAMSLIAVFTVNVFCDYMEGVDAVALRYAVISLLLLMQLFYTLSDFAKKQGPVRGLRITAFAIAVIICVLAVVAAIVVGFDFGAQRYNSISLTVIFVAAAAVAFAAGSLFNEKIYIAVAAIVAAFIVILAVLLMAGIPLTIYEDIDYIFVLVPAEAWFVPALLAPMCSLLIFIFKGKKFEKLASRILTAIAFVSLIPLLIYCFDVFAADSILGNYKHYAVLVSSRIIIVLTVMAYFAVAFDVVGLIRSLNIGGKKNED